MSSVAPDILVPGTPPAARGDNHGAQAPAAAILPGAHSYSSISEKISGIVLTAHAARWWVIAFAACSVLTLVFFGAIGYLFHTGVGIWGLNIPVVWAFDITNYVWWIAIAMSGTFISAALHLTRQPWGASISRFAEAMTVFALVIAGMFPIIHLGRPWFFYWLAPYPNVMGLWPQWRSPLVWDFFAILAYLLLSLMFWYLGLIPDFATLRDRARGRGRQIIYGLLALGWRGEARHWQRRQSAHLLLAALAVPLVVSVHSVVGLDFATGNTPGWHSTIFPPFFVAGAMFSGFAMAMTIVVLLRRAFDLGEFITERHLDNLAKLILAMGLVLAYSYVMELFMAWYSADRYEIYTALNRMRGAYAPVYWSLIFCVVVVPQALVVAARAPRTLGAVWHQHPDQCGHVARALHVDRHQRAPRLSALGLGHVLPDRLGLGDPGRLDRLFWLDAAAFRALRALDFHVGNARIAEPPAGCLMKPDGIGARLACRVFQPGGLAACGARRTWRWLSAARGVRTDAGRGPGRSAGIRRRAAAVAGARRRYRRRGGHLRPAMVERHRGLSPERRRPHAGLARFDSGHVRDDGTGRRAGHIFRGAAA